MHDGVVLEVGARADPDVVHVAADDGAEPDRGALADLDVADHDAARRDEDASGARRGAFPPNGWMIGIKRGC